MVIGMGPIHSFLWLLPLAVPPLPKDAAVAPIIGVYRLHQHVNGCEEAGQQRMVSGRPERSDKLVVRLD
jgi:hypothetical protein